MPEGTVVFFSIDNGFGFIRPDGGDRDLLVRDSDVADGHGGEALRLFEGARVSHDIVNGRTGRRATNVQVHGAEHRGAEC